MEEKDVDTLNNVFKDVARTPEGNRGYCMKEMGSRTNYGGIRI